MRPTIVLAAVVLLIFSFWAGYAYSEQRVAAFIAESLRSCNLSVAETALRTWDLVKDKGLTAAEEGVIMVAKSSADDVTHTMMTARFLVPDFGADEAVVVLRERNDARYGSLQKRLAQQR